MNEFVTVVAGGVDTIVFDSGTIWRETRSEALRLLMNGMNNNAFVMLKVKSEAIVNTVESPGAVVQ